jgi:hypothetical protein
MIGEGSMVTKQRNAPQGGSGAQPPLQTKLALITVVVGAAILACAFLTVTMRADLPYVGLFVYTGLATLLAGVGASAAVALQLPETGQRVWAGGAAAIAIALSWLIGPDKAPDTPRINMTYYVNFPDRIVRKPGDLVASVDITDEQQKPRENRDHLPLSQGPGGNAIKVTVPGVLTRDYVTLKIRSAKENKSWASSSVQFTESFMNLNEGD